MDEDDQFEGKEGGVEEEAGVKLFVGGPYQRTRKVPRFPPLLVNAPDQSILRLHSYYPLQCITSPPSLSDKTVEGTPCDVTRVDRNLISRLHLVHTNIWKEKASRVKTNEKY